MPNQIMVIQPYRHAGTWVFDDAEQDLDKEPFVSGVPEMIDALVAQIPDAESGFRLLFSADPFPGYQMTGEWLREEMDGHWYRAVELGQEGWLCPALFKYFDQAPEKIFVKAEPMA